MKPMPGHHIGRAEGGLFHFGKIVFRIAIQFQNADIDQRIILVRPTFVRSNGLYGSACPHRLSGMICT